MHTSSLIKRLAFIVSAVALITTSAVAAENPFLGRWALTIPGGGAGWLGITQDGAQLKASILWSGGSVVPVTSTKVKGDELILTHVREARQKDADGNSGAKQSSETITRRIKSNR